MGELPATAAMAPPYGVAWEGGVPGRLEGPYAVVVEGDGTTVSVLAEREVQAILKDVKRGYARDGGGGSRKRKAQD